MPLAFSLTKAENLFKIRFKFKALKISAKNDYT